MSATNPLLAPPTRPGPIAESPKTHGGSAAGKAIQLLLQLPDVIRQYRLRLKTRRALRGLDARLLDDVGLTPAQAQAEIRKPFWHG